MNENSENPEETPLFNVQHWLNDVVRRSLLQTGAMQAVEEKLREVAERSAQMTDTTETGDEEKSTA